MLRTEKVALGVAKIKSELIWVFSVGGGYLDEAKVF